MSASTSTSRLPKGFDVVIGNPPYVATYSRQSHAASEELQGTMHLSSSTLGAIDGHEVFSGRTNAFLCFLSLSAQMIHESGAFALVLPDTIITNESYAPMRRALLATSRVSQITLFSHAVFEGATVGTALVVGRRSEQPDQAVSLIRCSNEPGSGEGERRELRRTPAELALRPGVNWQPDASADQRSTMPMIPLGNIAEIKDGINPGPRAVRDRILSETPIGLNPRRTIEGGDIVPFRCQWDSLWVDYSEASITREEKKAGTSLRQSWIFDSPKIVYRQTAPRPIAAVDTSGLCTLNSVHCVILKEDDESSRDALCAYLNSDTCGRLYQSRTGETRKVFPQVHVSSMRELPVPEFLSDKHSPQVQHLAALHRKAVQLATAHGGSAPEIALHLKEVIAEIDAVLNGSAQNPPDDPEVGANS